MAPNTTGGLALNGAFNDGSANAGQAAVDLATSKVYLETPNGISADSSSSELGSYLVRPIPEPTTASLLALGLVGIAAGRRRLDSRVW